MVLRRQHDTGDASSVSDPLVAAATPPDETALAREDGQDLLDAADDAINRALSRDSSRFLAQSRQAGGQ